mgnify:CR=1 FL=1
MLKMKRLYIVTGAAGHLGYTLTRMLSEQGCEVRGLILPGEKAEALPGVTYCEGDVCRKETLLPLLEGAHGKNAAVIHTAGIVDISGQELPRLFSVNVGGTRNVADLCREKGLRMVYVSSVHAIPEKGKLDVLSEVKAFSPDDVVGGYAKSKAQATQVVLDAVRCGLDAVVVHPSGILGPYDRAGNHMVQMVSDYICGRLPACVRGGYDFVDVRDVARGCILAAEKGRAGECYILSGRHYEVREILAMVRQVEGGRSLPVLPMWMARAAAPLLGWTARVRHRRPLYTRYSLYTLRSNDRFSHDKATSELGYRPRDLRQTVADTVAWLRQNTPKKARRRRKRKKTCPTV